MKTGQAFLFVFSVIAIALLVIFALSRTGLGTSLLNVRDQLKQSSKIQLEPILD